jgi:hypothetical protein
MHQVYTHKEANPMQSWLYHTGTAGPLCIISSQHMYINWVYTHPNRLLGSTCLVYATAFPARTTLRDMYRLHCFTVETNSC